MAYRIVEVELSETLAPFTLGPHQDGFALLARWKGRLAGFYMAGATPGSSISTEELAALCVKRFGRRALALEVETALLERWSRGREMTPPSLTIAICTKDRAQRLARLLDSLKLVKETSRFLSTEILVVDNASVDSATRDAVAGFEGAQYVFEPRAGLDFARNAALRHATGDLLAFLDDDVVVDQHWLDGLFAAWAGCPDAGGFTGLVLPYRLDTAAQIQFELRGGFGRGFEPKRFHATSADNPLHPVGAGIVGAGCNMAFDRSLLVSLGGFDEALDTGAPLPGGGDLDIFYRVLRSGRTIAYEPRYAVYHEHRETMPQLRRQYWSWGLGFMAFLTKSRRDDPALKNKQDAILRWWLLDKFGDLAAAGCRFRLQELGFLMAELWGGLVGMAGEYDRSLKRVQKIRGRTS
ncbi:glycosyltransferase family 2 protein [Dongia deserti]|uniref:glycosyltransferase family 2 protein n=1 Tax=Dongia deserti TaxID=2268030 RepID=UPI000E654C47|nr:glycosyltransferase [Dongia deserti]